MSRPARLDPETAYRIAMAAALVFVVLRVLLLREDPLDILAISDNDDIMRFLSVRDLLAGQGWFDTVQYRILPPEGLPMHWSRYVDAGIAGLIGLAAWAVPPETAERIALTAWPGLALAALILVTGAGTKRVFGGLAAAFAMAMILVWPVTSYTYFRPARLDHHNVQIVLMTAMVLSLVLPGRHLLLGLVGGALAAMSLAVGLETMPLVGLAGAVLAARALRDPEGDGSRLLAFSGVLALGCAILFAGQTPPARWATAQCDQLSPSGLALVAIAAGASFALVLPARAGSRIAGVVAFALVLGLGLVAAAPLLQPCLTGPYAVLPPDVMRLIPTIREAHPAQWFLLNGPAVFWANVAPAIGAVAAAATVFLVRRATGRMGDAEARAAGTLLLLGAVALLGVFVQVRMIVLAAPLVPILSGYALTGLLAGRRGPAAVVALAAAVTTTMLPPTLHDMLRNSGPAAAAVAPTATDAGERCRRPDLVRTLDRLPPGRILSPINLGPPIVLLTRHAALAGPYHRRPEALANGVLPFEADAPGLHAALARTRADYLVLCRDVAYGEERSFARTLAAGAAAQGLVPAEGPDPAFVVFRVGPGEPPGS